MSFNKKTDCLRSKPLGFKVFLDNFHIFAKHFQFQVTYYVVTAKVKPEPKYY